MAQTTRRHADIFRGRVFREVPGAVLVAIALAVVVMGNGWTTRLAAVPWIVSLVLVGLPHGAADFSASRRAFRGGALLAVWTGYCVLMAAVAAGFVVAPVASIVSFALLSTWHFGDSHLDFDGDTPGAIHRPAAALARGGWVLAGPMIWWPELTAAAANDLAAIASGGGEANSVFPPAAIRTGGVILVAITIVAIAAEGVTAGRRPDGDRGCIRLVTDSAVIAALGMLADPLFSVGCYFLVWHAWRQMDPLAGRILGQSPSSWAGLRRGLVGIHAAALPLLVPTWVTIAVFLHLTGTDFSARRLALVTIAAYLVVTPAHELLGQSLRDGPSATRRRSRRDGTARAAWRAAATSRTSPPVSLARS